MLVRTLQGLGQYDAVDEWTESMKQWCQTNAIGSLHGRCRVHRAELFRPRLPRARAESEAIAACDELRPTFDVNSDGPLTELGHIRLHRGDIRSRIR